MVQDCEGPNRIFSNIGRKTYRPSLSHYSCGLSILGNDIAGEQDVPFELVPSFSRHALLWSLNNLRMTLRYC